MIYTPLTKKALKLSFEAHKDQVDKSGMPYVYHPFHLAEQMTTEETTAAALLHDVAEDAGITPEDLRSMGFDKRITDAVALMTHDKGEPYLTYVSRLRENPIARAVKIADLSHNSDLTRLDTVTDADKRRALKYKMALAILSDEGVTAARDGLRRTLPLDLDRFYFLGIVYRDGEPVSFTLDVEAAIDAHFTFKASETDAVMALLPRRESLPEALAEFLETRTGEDFAALLRRNGIQYESIHYDYYDL